MAPRHTPKTRPSKGGLTLVRVPAEFFQGYLAGRPHEDRVKYFTHVNNGKVYPKRDTPKAARALRLNPREAAE